MQMDMFGATQAKPPRYVGYADGSCSGNPGPGGWGYVLEDDNNRLIKEGYDSARVTTNNQMELTAALELLKQIPEGAVIEVFTDSKYVIDGLTSWMKGWKAKGWKTAKGDPVKNKELWVALDAVNTKRKAKFTWVRGHNGNPGNERADALANLGTDAAKLAAAA
jgi:ribonuclease HI